MLFVLIHSIMSNSAINVLWILDLARRGLNAEFINNLGTVYKLTITYRGCMRIGSLVSMFQYLMQ